MAHLLCVAAITSHFKHPVHSPADLLNLVRPSVEGCVRSQITDDAPLRTRRLTEVVNFQLTPYTARAHVGRCRKRLLLAEAHGVVTPVSIKKLKQERAAAEEFALWIQDEAERCARIRFPP